LGHHLLHRDFQQPSPRLLLAVVGHAPPCDHGPDRLWLCHPWHLTGGTFHTPDVLTVHRVVGESPGGLRDGDLAGFASETVRTQAVVVIDAVIALCPIFAWLAGTVVDVDGAETPFEAHLALAGEAVDPIMAGGTVGTGAHQAVVHVVLTESPHEASEAPAGEVAGKAVFVLTLPPVLAWRPAWREQGWVMAMESKQLPRPQGGKHTQPLVWPVGPALALSPGAAILREKTRQEFPPP